MAFSIFLNFEKLSIKIIEAEIAQMTDDNLFLEADGIDAVDDEKFENNLYHGSIAATFIVNLYETALNTILSRRLNCSEVEIFKTSHNVKLQLICVLFQTDLAEIKSNNAYGDLQAIIKLRNDITHYKSNLINVGHYISTDSTVPMGTSKVAVAELFTKTFMKKSYHAVMTVLKNLCQTCGLAIYTDCDVIDSDGKDCLCEFVVDRNYYDEIKQFEAELGRK